MYNSLDYWANVILAEIFFIPSSFYFSLFSSSPYSFPLSLPFLDKLSYSTSLSENHYGAQVNSLNT